MTQSPLSLYVHIPFCHRKCPYCDFNTYAVPKPPEEIYTKALLKELEYWSKHEYWQQHNLKTIFFGGGTPSFFTAESINKIILTAKELFPSSDMGEICIEANPKDLTKKYCKDLKKAGVNRVSIGAQSFNELTLKWLGRTHSKENIIEAANNLAKAEINNISIDILFGAPEQTLELLKQDLQTALSLPIKHISTYSLTIEEGTPYYQHTSRGLLPLPSEDTIIEMMEFIPKFLYENSFNRYEISNYAKEGFQSDHNKGYWTSRPYLGIGAGAHSYVNQDWGIRFSNYAAVNEYQKNVFQEGHAVSWKEELTKDKAFKDKVMTGIRMSEGLQKFEIVKKFGEDAWNKIVARSESLNLKRDAAIVAITCEAVTLTQKGILLADSVINILCAE